MTGDAGFDLDYDVEDDPRNTTRDEWLEHESSLHQEREAEWLASIEGNTP